MIEVKLVGVDIAVTDLEDIPGGKMIIFVDPMSKIQYAIPIGPNSCKTLAANLTAPRGIVITDQILIPSNGKNHAV